MATFWPFQNLNVKGLHDFWSRKMTTKVLLNYASRTAKTFIVSLLAIYLNINIILNGKKCAAKQSNDRKWLIFNMGIIYYTSNFDNNGLKIVFSE